MLKNVASWIAMNLKRTIMCWQPHFAADIRREQMEEGKTQNKEKPGMGEEHFHGYFKWQTRENWRQNDIVIVIKLILKEGNCIPINGSPEQLRKAKFVHISVLFWSIDRDIIKDATFRTSNFWSSSGVH